jgi:hypothetical protein
MPFWLDRPGLAPDHRVGSRAKQERRTRVGPLPLLLQVSKSTWARLLSHHKEKSARIELDDDLATRNSAPPMAYGLQDLRPCSSFSTHMEERLSSEQR